ncbi:MAG: molybdopterin-dependent oxidoreductase [Rhodobacteraceae bacterium]|nr:molybdopterin-dependent oxidoreductase [Paracoccaceae bacterium]
MSRIKTIARRTFLITSAAIVGGVAFGTYKYQQDAPNPLTAGKGEAALNPFVFIDQSGVTLIAPRAEMGQGVYTTWAALIAEELDVELADIRVLHGPPAKAYFNSAAMQDVLPGKGYDMSGFMHSLSQVIGGAGKFFDLQVTGGSTSMRDGFDRMRVAGATARETLKQAAAERLGVERASLSTKGGQVIAPDGTAITYSDLAEAAALIDPPKVTLRDPSQWRILGRTQPRVDMVAKVTGTAKYAIDTRVDGMRFATLRINPKLGGAMNSFDASEAEKMPGVDRVIDLGTGIAVVASNTWLAIQAAEAVEIDWGDAPYPPDTDGIFARIDKAFDSDANSAMRDDGDADTLPEGATLIEANYRAPFLAHATMEPMNAAAFYTGDALEVWAGNQSPTFTQAACAKAAGLENEAVRLHTPVMGGGFGRRVETDFSVYATRVAVAMKGIPVQVTWTREEDMRHDFYRSGALARFRGAVKDGKAVLMDGQISAARTTQQAVNRLAGMSPGGPDKGQVDGAFNQPYAIPNYRIRGYLADLEVPVGFWRSVSASFNGFFHDTFLDEMAHAAGRDPLEFRLELMREEHPASAGTLEAVREMSGWTGKTPDGVGRGVGYTYSFGTPVAQVIEVIDTADGIRINKAWIACDVGLALDPGNIEAQMIGGMIYGLSAACFGEITFYEGEVEQFNFPDYDVLRMHNTPVTEVRVLEANKYMGGVGEPGTPPAMPALGNALFDLTGTRARELPLSKTFDFVL